MATIEYGTEQTITKMKATQTDMHVFESLPGDLFGETDVKVRGFKNRMARMVSIGLVTQEGDKYKLADVRLICCGCSMASKESDLVDGPKKFNGLGTSQVCPRCGSDTHWRLKNPNI